MSENPQPSLTPHRFLFIRTRVKQQHKEPIQLDLFVPYDYDYEFKVILTNKPLGARKALVFHNGRGSQEGIFAELNAWNNAMARGSPNFKAAACWPSSLCGWVICWKMRSPIRQS